MGREIERKYLVRNRDFIAEATRSIKIEQGYLGHLPVTVRVRTYGDEAFITIKSKSQDGGLSRQEYEYPIPYAEALELLELCGEERLTKERFLVPYEGKTWEVDVFSGAYEGLIVAEVELSSTEETCPLPPWIGEEVTGQRRFYNGALAAALQARAAESTEAH